MVYSQEVQHMCCVKKGANHLQLRSQKKESGLGQKKSKIFPDLLTELAGALLNKVLAN